MTPEHKELISLAAKAMGYEIPEYSSPTDSGIYVTRKDNCSIIWNPLTSLSDRAKMCDE